MVIVKDVFVSAHIKLLIVKSLIVVPIRHNRTRVTVDILVQHSSRVVLIQELYIIVHATPVISLNICCIFTAKMGPTTQQ